MEVWARPGVTIHQSKVAANYDDRGYVRAMGLKRGNDSEEHFLNAYGWLHTTATNHAMLPMIVLRFSFS